MLIPSPKLNFVLIQVARDIKYLKTRILGVYYLLMRGINPEESKHEVDEDKI